MAITITEHAKRRWAERFPGLDMHSYCAGARRVGKKKKKIIKASCPEHAKQGWFGSSFKGRYYLINQGVVFVMATGETVITVLDFRGEL